ncbi:MAG: glycosyltransferase, partial [Acidimicrobiales bacterium]|nr:glycosyltransferase [Acidimicrobiales bacterium]
AVAHEWITQRAGSEKTFEQLAAVLPHAELYALTHTDGVEIETGGRPIQTSSLDRNPLLKNRRALALPFMPAAWRNISRDHYDLVVTSSHACAKGFRPGRDALHLSYVHAPMRYAWDREIDGRIGGSIDPLAPARSVLRHWDKGSTKWVDSFAANSTAVADRIKRYYGREARVIAPPVDVDYFSAASETERGHLLAFSRFIPYKRIDLAVQVAADLGEPLVIAGSGPMEKELRGLADEIAPGLVTFVISPSQAELRTLYAGARALIFPAYEDFGIIPIEAQAAGCPVVGLARGGSVDTVADGSTGLLVEDQTLEAFSAGTAALLEDPIDADRCRDHAAGFSSQRFRSEIGNWINDVLTDA